MLSNEEALRYSRQIRLDEIGVEGQEKLQGAKVLVIGAGGLGCPVLQYLSAAGVGTIGVVDFDVVSATNLHRQVLFSQADVGKEKVACAIDVLSKQNPFVKFVPHTKGINNNNALEIIKDYDLVIDGTDNFSTRYLVNDACVLLNKTLVYGSISKFEGQVSLFNAPTSNDERGPNYRCLFPEPPSPESAPNCSEVGVLGILPGIIGCLQANEAIKYITGAGQNLIGKLFVFNALNMSSYNITFGKAEEFAGPENFDELEDFDYDYFCSANQESDKEVTTQELKSLMENNRDTISVIDIREEGELPTTEGLSDQQMPFSTFVDNKHKLPENKQLILVCNSGNRSLNAIEAFNNEGFDDVVSLKGGIEDWLSTP